MANENEKATIKGLACGRRDLFAIDPRIIKEKADFNARLSYGDLTSLESYIRVHRQVPVPLKVFMEDGQIYVDQGHRRLRAVMNVIGEGIDIKSVECVAEPKHYNPEQRLIEMVASNEGQPLNMLEQGLVFTKLVNGGYNQAEVAEKVGKTQSHVSGCLLLSTVSKRVQNLIIDGTVAASTVLNLMREIDSEEALFTALTTAQNDANAEGAAKVTPSRARKAAGGNAKPMASKKVKELSDWYDENSIVLGERPKFKMVNYVLQFIKGDLSLDQLTTFTD